MRRLACGFALLLAVGGGRAAAAPILITGYDVTNARPAGYGGWNHFYDGTITPAIGGLVDYTGGRGTLTDGVAGTSISNNQLFEDLNQPTITFYLDGFHQINHVRFYASAGTSPFVGSITSVDVTINGVTQTVSTTNTTGGGPGLQTIEFIRLGSVLSGLATSAVTISNVRADGNLFAISEAQVDGTRVVASAVPEPASMSLLALGAVGMVGYRIRRRKAGAGTAAVA